MVIEGNEDTCIFVATLEGGGPPHSGPFGKGSPGLGTAFAYSSSA